MKLTGKALDLVVDAAPDFESPGSRSSPAATIVGGLFRQHAKRVQQFMSFRLRDREDGQEASQEMFLKLWRQETQGNLREDAVSYMFSAARTAIVDTERHRKSRAQDQQEEGDFDAVAAVEADQDEALHWRRAMGRLAEIVKSLPEVTRKAFLLHYFNEMNYDQIAEELGVSRRTVERHVARAFAHCRTRMKDYL